MNSYLSGRYTVSSKLTSFLGCHHYRTSSYHLQANGILEMFHRQPKVSLTAAQREHWSLPFPWYYLALELPSRRTFTASVPTWSTAPLHACLVNCQFLPIMLRPAAHRTSLPS